MNTTVSNGRMQRGMCQMCTTN